MPRRRFRPNSCKLYAAGYEPRVLMFLTAERASAMVRDNKATEMRDDQGRLVGIQLCEKANVAKAQKVVVIPQRTDSRESCRVLSRAEVEAYAEGRKSRTLGLPFTSWIRDQRIANKLPEMDLVEQARVKMDAMFPVAQGV